MKVQSIILLAISIFLLTSCATNYRISSDYEKETNFNSFTTYDYLNHNHNFPIGANPINQQRIEQALESELATLGYKKSADADLLISWFVTVETVRKVDYNYRDFYGRWHYPYFGKVYEYKVGTLVVDIIDKANNKVVWHGKTTDQVYEGMPNVERKIKDAVNAIFKKYAKDTKWKKRDFAMN